MNNREIASVAWLAVALLWVVVAVPDARRAPGEVLKTLASPKLVVPLLAMLVYIGALVYAASRIGLWQGALTSDTVAWFILTGLGLLGASVSVFKRGWSFKRVVLAALGITLVVEVFVNLYVFPLVVELLLAPALAFLVALSVVAETEERFATVKKLVDGLLSLIGFAVIAIVAITLARNWDDFDEALTWQRFALPVWLTLGALPIVAVLGVYSAYDSAFAMIRWASDDPRRRRRAQVALLTGLHLSPREVAAFNGLWCKELTATGSLAEARAVVRRFRRREPGTVAP